VYESSNNTQGIAGGWESRPGHFPSGRQLGVPQDILKIEISSKIMEKKRTLNFF